MSSTIDLSELVEAIHEMEGRLADMKKMLQSAGAKKKAKRERDPAAPKREANDWIKFTQRVEALLKDEGVMFKRIADSKKFASSLKSKKAYDEWADGEILKARDSWDAAATKAASASAAESAEESAAEAAAPKKRGRKPMTTEQKVAAKAVRDAKKNAAVESETDA